MVASEEHFRGSMLGLALGDALGAPFENRSPEEIRRRYPNAGRLLHEPPGATLRYTDDTQMAIAVAEALLVTDEPDADAYADRYVANYQNWRGYGRGARTVMAALEGGASAQEAATIAFPEGSWGNGAAMRVAAVGLRFAEQPSRLRDQARESSLATHCHPVAVEGAILLAHATANALRSAGKSLDLDGWWDALEPVAQHDEYTARIAKARTVRQPDDLFALGTGIAAAESVITAIACFALHADDFVATVGEAVRLGGDCDTIAAMAGALAGARLGEAALPEVWLERLENRHKGRDYIAALARRLATHGPLPSA